MNMKSIAIMAVCAPVVWVVMGQGTGGLADKMKQKQYAKLDPADAVCNPVGRTRVCKLTTGATCTVDADPIHKTPVGTCITADRKHHSITYYAAHFTNYFTDGRYTHQTKW